MAQRWKKAGSLTTGGMSLNVFTQDEMDAIHRATLEVLEHTGVEAVNLGTGRGSSVLEIVSAYSKACGRELPYRGHRQIPSVDGCGCRIMCARNPAPRRAHPGP